MTNFMRLFLLWSNFFVICLFLSTALCVFFYLSFVFFFFPVFNSFESLSRRILTLSSYISSLYASIYHLLRFIYSSIRLSIQLLIHTCPFSHLFIHLFIIISTFVDMSNSQSVSSLPSINVHFFLISFHEFHIKKRIPFSQSPLPYTYGLNIFNNNLYYLLSTPFVSWSPVPTISIEKNKKEKKNSERHN